MSWRDYERLVASALTSNDPISAMRSASRSKRLSKELRKGLSIATDQADGLLLTALLIARLRFERLIRGSADAEQWYLDNPEAFTRAFKRYHYEVPAKSFFPQTEAVAWSKWVAKNQRWIRRIA